MVLRSGKDRDGNSGAEPTEDQNLAESRMTQNVYNLSGGGKFCDTTTQRCGR